MRGVPGSWTDLLLAGVSTQVSSSWAVLIPQFGTKFAFLRGRSAHKFNDLHLKYGMLLTTS